MKNKINNLTLHTAASPVNTRKCNVSDISDLGFTMAINENF